MKKQNLVRYLLTLITFMPLAVNAGREAGNGGDAIVMPNEVRFLDLVRDPRSIVLDIESEGLIDELDRTIAAHPGYVGTVHFPAARRTINAKDAILASLRRLDFFLVPGPIPESNDRGTVMLPWNLQGVIVRLALQDVWTKKVIVDRDHYNKLPRRDKLAFLLHEALIRVYYDDMPNPNTNPLTSTEKIANLVHATFRSMEGEARGLSARSVSRYLCEIGIHAAAGNSSHIGLDRFAGERNRNARYPTLFHVYTKSITGCEVSNLGISRQHEGRIVTSGYPTARFVREWQAVEWFAMSSEFDNQFIPATIIFSIGRNGDHSLALLRTRPGTIPVIDSLISQDEVIRIYTLPN